METAAGSQGGGGPGEGAPGAPERNFPGSAASVALDLQPRPTRSLALGPSPPSLSLRQSGLLGPSLLSLSWKYVPPPSITPLSYSVGKAPSLDHSTSQPTRPLGSSPCVQSTLRPPKDVSLGCNCYSAALFLLSDNGDQHPQPTVWVITEPRGAPWAPQRLPAPVCSHAPGNVLSTAVSTLPSLPCPHVRSFIFNVLWI